jgi:hypothetical protein
MGCANSCPRVFAWPHLLVWLIPRPFPCVVSEFVWQLKERIRKGIPDSFRVGVYQLILQTKVTAVSPENRTLYTVRHVRLCCTRVFLLSACIRFSSNMSFVVLIGIRFSSNTTFVVRFPWGNV